MRTEPNLPYTQPTHKARSCQERAHVEHARSTALRSAPVPLRPRSPAPLHSPSHARELRSK